MGGAAGAHLAAFGRVLASGQAETLEYQLQFASGPRWFLSRISPIPAADGSWQTISVLARDITERKRSEQRLAAQYAVARALAEANNLADATPDLLRGLGSSLEWPWGALWIVDRRSGRLRCQSFWHEEDIDVPALDAFSREMVLALGQGLVGRVWQSAGPIWIVDAAAETDLPRAPVAASTGLHGAVAFPILLDREVLGVVEFFDTAAREPDQEQLAALAVVGSQIGQFIRRRRAEETLQESERRFRALIEHSTDVATMFDSQGMIVYASPSIERLMGYTPEEMLGQNRMTFIDPDQYGDTADAFANLLQEPGKFVTVQRRVRHKDGSWRWLEVIATNWLDEPAVRAVVANLRDITERRQAEESLRESERRFRALIEHSSDVAMMFDGQGTILYVSPAVERLLGYRPEEMVGRHRLTFIDPDQHDATGAAWASLLQDSGKSYTAQRRVRHKDGSWRWLEVIATNWLDEPAVRTVVGNLRDVTERKQAEDALRESEQRFRDYAETASDYLWETGPDHRFTRSENFATLNQFPFLRIGLWRWDFATDVEEEPEKWRRHIATLEARQPFRDFRYRTTGPDGSPMYMATSGKPVFDPEGCFLGYRGGSSDVTAAVRAAQAEEALQNVRAALAHATRLTTLGELTASIAHEINQPLAGVVTNASAARRWLAAQPPNLNEVREALDRITRDANRASDIIIRIRALLNKAATPTQRLSMNETIQEVVALTRSELQMSQVMLNLQLADDLPPVIGDRIQLQQVILNLIVNAIEAMRGHAAGPRELLVGSCRDAANGVLVRVEDSGPGLDPAGVGRLFDTFYTTKPDGMGMGLAISRSIVEAHGGRLWATPNAPRGAVFHFSVPVAECDEATSDQAEAAVPLVSPQ
jgi:PAS domain S-box-containing protein